MQWVLTNETYVGLSGTLRKAPSVALLSREGPLLCSSALLFFWSVVWLELWQHLRLGCGQGDASQVPAYVEQEDRAWVLIGLTC